MIFIPLINYFDASLIAVRKTCPLKTVIRGIKLSLLCKHLDFSIRLWRRRRIEFEDYESVGNMIYFNHFLNRLESNPFQLEERTYPVDFGYKRKYAYFVKVNIADNYKIISVPEKVALALPNKGGSFVSNVSIKDNVVTIFSQISINKSKYSPSEYFYLKEFYSQIIKTQNSLITLEKI